MSFAGAFGAFDAQDVDFPLDVAKDEISALSHKCGHQISIAGYPLSRAYRFDL
jgi:hypothetical protein